MDLRALSELIDAHNLGNDEAAIGLNFVVAGLSRLQSFILQVERGALDEGHRELLSEAAEMLAFGAERLPAREPSLSRFVARHRALVKALLEATAPR